MSVGTLMALDEEHDGVMPPRPRRMVVYLDIETVSSGEWLREQIKEMDPADGAVWASEHVGDQALGPLHGRIVCWALATSVDTQLVRSSTDELDLLLRLHHSLRVCEPAQIVAHYGHGFDFPFIRARALAHGLDELARYLCPLDTRLVDTCSPMWLPSPPWGSGTGWPRSLDDIATLLGVARAKTIPGSEVPCAWYLGRYDEVEAHCLDDVKTLRWVHRRLAAGRSR